MFLTGHVQPRRLAVDLDQERQAVYRGQLQVRLASAIEKAIGEPVWVHGAELLYIGRALRGSIRASRASPGQLVRR